MKAPEVFQGQKISHRTQGYSTMLAFSKTTVPMFEGFNPKQLGIGIPACMEGYMYNSTCPPSIRHGKRLVSHSEQVNQQAPAKTPTQPSAADECLDCAI